MSDGFKLLRWLCFVSASKPFVRFNRFLFGVFKEPFRYRTVPMHNIVVFSDYCMFKEIENDSDAQIIRLKHLYKTIWRIEQETDPRLTEDDIEWIYSKLTSDKESGDSVVAEHILKVNRIKQQKVREQNSTGTTCPRCGSPLVLRDGQYGRFYGCMRYPACKYTRKR